MKLEGYEPAEGDTFNYPSDEHPDMEVTVEFVGEETRAVDTDGGTYGDLLASFDVSKHEVSVLVDGQPVPEDEPIDETVEHVRVVRLIQGG